LKPLFEEKIETLFDEPTEKQQLKEFLDIAFGRIKKSNVSDNKDLILKSVHFVFSSGDVDFQKQYIHNFLDDSCNAYIIQVIQMIQIMLVV